MSSSESARLVLCAVWLVATLVLTSAQLRVLAGSPPRTRRYVVAWVVSTLILGGLLHVMDRMIGAIDWRRQLMNVCVAGTVAVAGLVAGTGLARWKLWHRLHGSLRFLVLLLAEAVVVFAVGYPLL